MESKVILYSHVREHDVKAYFIVNIKLDVMNRFIKARNAFCFL